MKNINISEYNILLIDDDNEYAETTKIILQNYGFSILVHNNPITAVDYIKQNKVDIILLDYFMPQQTGEEFLANLREFDKETLVLLQTGYAGEKSQSDMIKHLNIQGYYDKSQNIDVLIALLYSAIKQTILLRDIKKYEEEKHIRDLKDKFFASRIKNIHSAILNPLMLVGGSTLGVENFIEENAIHNSGKEFLQKQINYSKLGTSDILNSIEALDISSEHSMTLKSVINKIKILLNSDIIKNNVDIIDEISDNYYYIDLQNGYIPFLISKLILELINVDNKKIKISNTYSNNTILLNIEVINKLPLELENEIISIANTCKDTDFSCKTFSYIIKLNKI